MIMLEAYSEVISKKFVISTKQRESFASDANEVANYIILRMAAHDEKFKNVFDGFIGNASYLDALIVDIPDEFNYHIKLKMPFVITPMIDSKRTGFMHLKANGIHKIIENDFVSRHKLQQWIRDLLAKAINYRIPIQMPNTNRKYKINYHKSEYKLVHTIWAIDINDRYRKLMLNFMPIFAFKAKQTTVKVPFENCVNDTFVYLLPQGKPPFDETYDRAFLLYEPQIGCDLIRGKENFRNSLHLLKAIRDRNDISHMSSYILNSIYLIQLDQQSNSFWQQSIGDIILYMLQNFLDCLRNKNLPFYMIEQCDYMRQLNRLEIINYQREVLELQHKLLDLKRKGCQPIAHLGYIFK